MINNELLLKGFKKCKTPGAVPMVHAENGDAVAEGQKRIFDLGITGPEGHGLSRPPMLEGEATSRAIRLASFENVPLYVVHVMSIDAMEEIAKAQKSGQEVVGEAVVSGLALDDSALWDPDFTTAVCSKVCHESPNKKAGHGKALQAALSRRILKLVGTDTWSKGKGKVEVTIVGGKVVWENGELKVEPGSGRYIEIPPFGHLFSGIGKADAAYLSSLRAPVHRPSSEVRPPPLLRPTGRPRKSRRKDEDELTNATTRRCAKCGQYEHFKKTCKGPLMPDKTILQKNKLTRVDTRRSLEEMRVEFSFSTSGQQSATQTFGKATRQTT
ncbi:hypothetical protein GIB67_016499 [Kingdonia uniflora]|uniref:Uncharacterized protein n=1 Tax=Kingdonia uniflora TaxID=39325 RepID=A0A7J7M800_9MAGN|nr:hypothetical protein GIB67_016499 [Kingdonia uniflora]